jgi:hypothetical protein
MSAAKDLFVEVAAGSNLFKEGDPAHELYIIESGQIELIPPGAADMRISLGPGDCCGEAALLDNQPHTVTAIAKSRTRLLRIERAAVPDVLRANADVAVALLRKFAARLAHLESCLADVTPTRAPPVAKSAPPAKAAAAKAAEAPAPARAPVTTTPPPPSAPPKAPPPAPDKLATPQAMALRVLASGHLLPLDPARSEFLVGRPDPATGSTPEIDLGPFDTQRTLSRRHAKILRDGDQIQVREDAATTNGTYLNGERLQTGVAAPLKPGDKLRFGSIEVELVAAQESA